MFDEAPERACALTKKIIEDLPTPSTGQKIYRDSRLRGLGVRVGQASKTFIVEGQVNRRTRRVSLGRADVLSVEEARRRAKSILAEMSAGIDPTQKRREAEREAVTCARAFELFEASKPSLATCTRDSYRRTFEVYLGDWRHRPIAEITRPMVLARHQKLTEERGATTANNVFRHLRSVYNFTAASHDSFPENPVGILTQARAWNRETRRRRVVSAQSLPRWWTAVMSETPEARDVLLIAILTGLRRSEIVSLRWEYIDLVTRTLTIPKTKNGDPHELPMSSFLVGVIAARRELAGQSEWLFPGVGRTGHLVEVKSFVSRVAAASGVNFSLHDLRRTFVTVAESLDIPHYALKRLLNHRSDSDVTGGYIVINTERLRDPMERITQRILELAGDQTTWQV